MNDILRPIPAKVTVKCMEQNLDFNEFFDMTNIIRKPKRKIYLDITYYNVNPRQKIKAVQINSQQILQSLW